MLGVLAYLLSVCTSACAQRACSGECTTVRGGVVGPMASVVPEMHTRILSARLTCSIPVVPYAFGLCQCGHMQCPSAKCNMDFGMQCPETTAV
jgi:hypothetical protein